MSESLEFARHQALQARCLKRWDPALAISLDDLQQSIPARFEKVVARAPEATAVHCPDVALTYRELNEAANRLAVAILRARGPGAEPVGILVRHGAAAVVAMLAVLKAGKFYIALDPHHPSERLLHMLQDTGTAIIVSEQHFSDRVSELARSGGPVLMVENAAAEAGDCPSASLIGPESNAAIYYTSASTGRPKGIVYTHRYLLHNMRNYGHAFGTAQHDRWTWLHSVGFSPASTDIFCTLLHGATLVPWNVQDDGLSGLSEWLDSAHVTVFHWMASPFRTFATTLETARIFRHVRLMIFGGEKLFARDALAFRRHFSSECAFANRLGASEVGLYQLYYFDQETVFPSRLVPAGYGVPDKTAVILNENGGEAAPGTVGEIGVRSRYFPPGYWQRPQLTRERYREPSPDATERLYLTGDLGRMRPDGCLEYHGRKDLQVKIRGNRVETAEVEAALREVPGIRDAAVETFEGTTGELNLAGYFATDPADNVDESIVRAELTGRIPVYMVPAALVRVPALPYNANGKLDRARLPPVNLTLRSGSGRYSLPRTPLEHHLVELWQTVLELEPIGIDDDFFEIGGDSLKAMRILNLLQPLVIAALPLPLLFEHSTISSLAGFLEAAHGVELAQNLPLNGIGRPPWTAMSDALP